MLFNVFLYVSCSVAFSFIAVATAGLFMPDKYMNGPLHI